MLSEYEKQIKNLDFGQTGKTIIRKLSAILIEFDSTINSYNSDNYISIAEELDLVHKFIEILNIFEKIETQFKINSEDTTQLIQIYHTHFKTPVISVINLLSMQENDEIIKAKYKLLIDEINNLVQ